jgi:hypothetical protein
MYIKETKLDDSADIYKKRDEEKKPKARFSELTTRKEKWNWFAAYYLKAVIAALVILILIAYFVIQIVSPKDVSNLTVAFINYPYTQDEMDKMSDEFIKADNIELGEHQILDFRSDYSLNSDYDYSAATTLATHIMAQELDIFIAPESTFKNYCFNGTMANLESVLTSDAYDGIKDSLFYAKERDDDADVEQTYDESDASEQPFGVYLEDTAFYDEFGGEYSKDEKMVVGIVVNTKRKDMAVKFLEWITGK